MLFKLLPIMVIALACCRSANGDRSVEALLDELYGDEPTKGSVDNPATGNGPTKGSVDNPATGNGHGPTKGSGDKPATVSGEVETCKLSNGGQGVCTPYYLCESVELPLLQGIVDTRVEQQQTCSSYIDECCDPSKMKMPVEHQ